MNKNSYGGIIFYVALILSGVILVILGWNDFWCAFSKPIDLNQADVLSLKKDMHVTAEVMGVGGVYANESKEIARYGVAENVSEDTSKYYLIVLSRYFEATDTAKDYFITAKITADQYEDFERIKTDTYEKWDGNYVFEEADNEKVLIEGQIKKLDKKLVKIMDEFFVTGEIAPYAESGLVSSENSIHYYINPIHPLRSIIMESLGLLLFIVGSIFIILASKRNANGMTYGGIVSPDAPTYGASPLAHSGMNQEKKTREEIAASYGVGQTIFINGNSYKKSELEKVDKYIKEGKIDVAKLELITLEGMDTYALDQVINNWDKIYK